MNNKVISAHTLTRLSILFGQAYRLSLRVQIVCIIEAASGPIGLATDVLFMQHLFDVKKYK